MFVVHMATYYFSFIIVRFTEIKPLVRRVLKRSENSSSFLYFTLLQWLQSKQATIENNWASAKKGKKNEGKMTEAGMNLNKATGHWKSKHGKTCPEKLFWLTGRQQTIFIIKSPVTFCVIPILISFSLKGNFITHSGTTHFRATRYLARYLYVSIMYDICIVYESKTLQHTSSNDLRPSSH